MGGISKEGWAVYTRQVSLVFSVVVLTAAVLSGCGGAGSGGGPGPASVAPASAPTGRIVFESNRTGKYDIFSMNADGSGEKNLTAGDTNDDREPCLSRDGTMIAYSAARANGNYIFVMKADGTGKQQITFGLGVQDENPTWSPNGADIAFSRGREHQSNRLYAISAEGLGIKLLSTATSTKFYCLDPAWSPLGNKIALEIYKYGWTQIYTMPAAGGATTPLTSAADQDFEPAWSPNGLMMAFCQDLKVKSGPAVYRYQIFTMNANGSDQVRFTTTAAQDEWPSWSPDGNYLAFDSNRAGMNQDIYVKGVTGSYFKRLTTKGGDHPSWGPAS
jgi:TolB protein